MLYKILFAFSFICWRCDSCQIAGQELVTPKPRDWRGFLGDSKSDKCWAEFDDMDNFEPDNAWYTEKLREQLDNENDIGDFMKMLLDNSDILEKHIKDYMGQLKEFNKKFSKGGNFKRSFSMISVGELHIRSELPVSIVTTNGNVKYVFPLTGRLDKSNYRVNGQEIEIQFTIGGKKRYTDIILPPNVNIDHIKIEALSDVIEISGLHAGQNQNGFMNYLWKFVPRFFTRN